MSERVAVVLSGAAARGAFQAGALATLMPALAAEGLSPTIWLGTSAGSINAALWGSYVDDGVAQAAEQVNRTWARMGRGNVMTHPATSLVLRDAPAFVLSSLGLGAGLTSLLDTAPLAATAADVLDTDRLAANVDSGVVDAVGVVATRIPPPAADPQAEGPAHARTVVFIDSATLDVAPVNDPDRAVDAAPGRVQADHVLASCAIPLGFPPQWVDQPVDHRGWYVDGGVRLNTPLRPAVALGADRIVVVSAMSTEYGQALHPSRPGEPIPDMAATGAQVMHSVLADRMTEDIRTLRSRNSAAEQSQAAGTPLLRSSGQPVRTIPLLTVSPAPGQLGVLASDILDEKVRGSVLGRLRSSDHYALDRALRGIGDGAGRRELLSYLFFDSDYFRAQVELGRQAAAAALATGWTLT